MAPRTSSRPTAAVAVVLTILAGIVVACGSPGTPDGGVSPTPPTPSPSLAATVAPTPTGPPPSEAGQDAPPDAVLAVDGGDPVTGQLGTYVWFGTGSDSPWLQGAPLRVGPGEPLTLRLIPDGAIEHWTARYVAAAAGDPSGARPLGQGSVSVQFGAPESGDWTVEVSITFAGGAGEAAYFWRLEVE